ncbi:MAG TPA: dihydroorotate dehydrogenase-like protein [Acetobacteraceae bacterium]|nr:dihydroorotate dehydrogenase-like protein [Acetobacteraceae bacterium]
MDLTTTYLGLALKNPVVASASPLTIGLDNIRRIEDAGGAAVVLPSLFEEQIEQEANRFEAYTTAGPAGFGEMLSYLPTAASYRTGPHEYLETIRRAHDSVAIPLIASLNGVTGAGWTKHTRLAQDAGASAIELNVFFIPADPSLDAQQVEQRYVDVLHAVKAAVSIPVSMKLSPYFSALAHTVRVLGRAGADGFVLFNRFYQPDIDLASLQLRHDIELSTPAEIRLPILWLGVLFGQVAGSLAASTGVETSDEVIKYLLAGADVVMTASALLRHGIGHLQTLLAGLTEWLTARDATSLSDMRGQLSQRMIKDPVAYERVNYIKMLHGHISGDKQ